MTTARWSERRHRRSGRPDWAVEETEGPGANRGLFYLVASYFGWALDNSDQLYTIVWTQRLPSISGNLVDVNRSWPVAAARIGTNNEWRRLGLRDRRFDPAANKVARTSFAKFWHFTPKARTSRSTASSRNLSYFYPHSSFAERDDDYVGLTMICECEPLKGGVQQSVQLLDSGLRLSREWRWIAVQQLNQLEDT
jgi:hypothetical protein